MLSARSLHPPGGRAFVLMGLLVFPSYVLPVAGQAVLVALVLMLIARPVAVLLTLVPLRVPAREIAFVSWVGLRGATPIILAMFPVVAGIPDADTIFNVVFFVVLLSVVAQGTTIPAAARRLGVAAPFTATDQYTFDAIITGDEGQGLAGSSRPRVGRRSRQATASCSWPRTTRIGPLASC